MNCLFCFVLTHFSAGVTGFLCLQEFLTHSRCHFLAGFRHCEDLLLGHLPAIWLLVSLISMQPNLLVFCLVVYVYNVLFKKFLLGLGPKISSYMSCVSFTLLSFMLRPESVWSHLHVEPGGTCFLPPTWHLLTTPMSLWRTCHPSALAWAPPGPWSSQ